ncbi:MAG: tryptophan--tRNA ligase [Spirochaetes bacterium]|nr:tryptophan--tRNA ligase [Spirochaetota bacterium]
MKRILTGDRPTGPLHIGHYFGSLKQRVELQEEYDTFILIADVQALTDNFETPEKVRDNILEVTLDYLAAGIDPQKSNIVIQSKIPAIAELTVFFSNLVTISRLSRNPTLKEEIKQKQNLFGNDRLTFGFFGYPVSQAADILSFNANLVPVGEDQLPMIELTREIARKFNTIYKEVFVEPEPKLGTTGRIKGLDGNSKMSKSLGNAIYLKDDKDELKKKIFNAYTDPLKARKNDPGHPEGCMVYYYHKLFTKSFENIYNECIKGERGCVQCKGELLENINNFLEPIREKRKYYESNINKVKEILYQGTNNAIKLTNDILLKAKEAMKIDYKEIFY